MRQLTCDTRSVAQLEGGSASPVLVRGLTFGPRVGQSHNPHIAGQLEPVEPCACVDAMAEGAPNQMAVRCPPRVAGFVNGAADVLHGVDSLAAGTSPFQRSNLLLNPSVELLLV